MKMHSLFEASSGIEKASPNIGLSSKYTSTLRKPEIINYKAHSYTSMMPKETIY